ncbi:hypothetical protein [Salmonella phage GSP001]|uniref:Uncharacterized protein n=1 Tax=Salmonella phage GSP001 TaxID=2962598 RepID=A0A9E7PFS8_9CAUD|nr:hypothetical protein [Salmonella phage GSP001]
MDRALRRHHRQRVKNNRKHYWNAGSKSDVAVGKMIKTPCLCSCCMCMSPRKLYGNSRVGLKISEIRKMQDEFDGFVGWGEGIDSGAFEDERPDL